MRAAIKTPAVKTFAVKIHPLFCIMLHMLLQAFCMLSDVHKHLRRISAMIYLASLHLCWQVHSDFGMLSRRFQKVIPAVQSQMSESRSGTVEIKGVNAEDMEVILQYLYGTLACIPEAQLQSLLLATDHLQVPCLLWLSAPDQELNTFSHPCISQCAVCHISACHTSLIRTPCMLADQFMSPGQGCISHACLL